MRLLLDTNILIWLLEGDPRLRPDLLAKLDSAEALFLSAVSVFEIGQKVAAGKLAAADYEGLAQSMGCNSLALAAEHARRAAALPPIHRDPFDRMLVAQAQTESLTLVTSDETLRRYGVPVLP